MQNTPTDEIDLMQLLARFCFTLRKNLAFTIGLPLAGAIIMLAVSYKSKDLFESALLIETSLLTENECNFMFQQLNKYGVIPGLTPEQDKEVSKFTFEVAKTEVLEKSPKETTLNEKSIYIQITARVFNKDVFPALEDALVKFINENPSVMRHRNEREKFYAEMITRINQELTAMDEVKSQVNSKAQATYLNPGELFENSVALFKEKSEYEIKREEIKHVHLIKGFDSLTIDAKMSKPLVAILGFILGFIVLCITLFVEYFVNYLKQYKTTA